MNTKNVIFVFCLVMLFTIHACSPAQPEQPNSPPPTARPREKNTAVILPTAIENTQAENPTDVESPTQAEPPTLAAIPASDTEFNLSTANQAVPQDILKEIAYFATGGGNSPCVGDQKYDKPKVEQNPAGGELLITLSTFMTCGWKADEVVRATITYPDGKKSTQTVDAKLADGTGKYYVILEFRPNLDDPEGKYTFTLEGSSGKVQAKATFYRPRGIRIYRMDETHILLHGFKPAEMVKVFYYYAGKFAGWQQYQMDSSGRLKIRFVGKVDATDKNNLFVAIGKDSGEVRSLNDSYWGRGAENWVENLSITKNFCAGFSSRLGIGIRAQVTFTDGTDMRIRAKPGFDQEILHEVPEGTLIRIIRGPRCKDNSVWWYAMLDDGKTGWMAESQKNVRLLDLYNP